ncbi:MAG: hypothetical protein GY845_23720 [Planctomycetes bacterium]|nr:hypothetical protein [Planctomycetota bacterium]
MMLKDEADQWIAEKYEPFAPKDPEALVLKDAGVETFAKAFKEHSPARHAYNCYDGWSKYNSKTHQWEKIPDDRELMYDIRTFMKTVRVTYKKVVRNKEEVKVGPASEKMKSPYFVKNVMNWIDMDGVHLRPDQQAPCSLDGKMDVTKVFAMANGILDVTNLKPVLLEHTPELYTFNYLPYAYDLDAEANKWLWALGQYFQNEDGSPDTIAQDVIHSWIFRYLTGDTSCQKILTILGKKRSGKGTIARAIRKAIGIDNCTSLTITGLTKSFGLQPLLNKRLGIFWDASLNSRNADTLRAVEILKMVSGEDGFNVDVKGKTHVEAPQLNLNLLLMANEMLNLQDSVGVLASRCSFLETTQSFYGREDPTIEHEIEKELPGILNLAIKAPRGLIEHPVSERLTREAEELGSPYISFFNDWCVSGEQYWIPKWLVWLYYCEWARQSNHREPSDRSFAIRFAAAVEGLKDRRRRLYEMDFHCLISDYHLAGPEHDQNGPECRRHPRPPGWDGIDIAPEVRNCWRIK